MSSVKLQYLCAKYDKPMPATSKIVKTRQPPAKNTPPSGLYDNYQRKKDQELMEEAAFIDAGIVPSSLMKIVTTSGLENRQLSTSQICTSRSVNNGKNKGTSLNGTATALGNSCRDKKGPETSSLLHGTSLCAQSLTRSLQLKDLEPSSASVLPNAHAKPRIPYKELDRLAVSRAAELEIELVKTERRYAGRVNRVVLSGRN